MERTLSVLDYAILVISAPDGIQSHTELLMELLSSHHIPTFVFINKTDLEHSPFAMPENWIEYGPSFEEEAVDENEEIPSVETVVEETELSENSELSEDKETIPVDADETEIHEETETVSAEDSSDKLSADLFIKLRALSEYLPVDKKLEFQDSRESLMLDYIIRKLSGEPGLLETAQEVRDNLHIQDEPVDDLNLNQTADVISGMKSYLASLPDRKLAHSLQNQMDGAIKRLTDE